MVVGHPAFGPNVSAARCRCVDADESDISTCSHAAEPGTPHDYIAILQVSSLALSSSRQTLSKIRFVDLPFESRKKYL